MPVTTERLRLLTRGAAGVAALVVTVCALSGCEVSQINWQNRTYTVSSDCVQQATVNLHDGSAVTPNGVTVTLQHVLLGGDINGDGVPDAVLFFACTNGSEKGSEIQVFSRNAKPLARLLPPYYYLQPLGSFDPSNIKVSKGNLYTGAFYANGVYAVFKWVWTGQAFHPEYFSGKHN